jgi:hypothetical protein
MIEKRFEQVKTVYEIAPVFLKDEGRIEAFFTLYFLALLVQALIERELRLAMKRENIDELPLYPEQRQCARPTTEQILRLFSLAERHRLIDGVHTVQVFDIPLTELQRRLLRLLGVPEDGVPLHWGRWAHPTPLRSCRQWRLNGEQVVRAEPGNI